MLSTFDFAAVGGRFESIVRDARLQRESPVALWVEPALLALEGMDKDLAVKLARQGITRLDDPAELATDELAELTGIDHERAADLITKARAHWFE